MDRGKIPREPFRQVDVRHRTACGIAEAPGQRGKWAVEAVGDENDCFPGVFDGGAVDPRDAFGRDNDTADPVRGPVHE